MGTCASVYVEVRGQCLESQFSPSIVGSSDRKKQELLPRKHLGSHILDYIEARAFNPKKHLDSCVLCCIEAGALPEGASQLPIYCIVFKLQHLKVDALPFVF